jgi:predicted ATPase/DNA-binding CsgD family transcriptional regulator
MDHSNIPRHPVLVEDLTEREMDVLRLKARNRSNQEIADELVLALSTVKWYVGQIYGKLGVANRRQAVARAQALGLIEGPPTPSLRPHHNLPAQTTSFIGREQELDDLEALLADPKVRLVTILAPGGMGKTRLGLAVAEAHLDRFADGVYMVPLAPLRSPDQIVTAIAEATHFPFMPDERSPRQQVLDFLRQKHMLLLLDNFEHLLDGAGLVTEMLHAAPAVQVVVTTRERLNLRGETVYTVGGMIFPDWETPEDALEYDAVRLFMQCTEQACPGFEIHPDDLRFLARICRLVEGMPLGIVLAAAWTEVLSLKEIANEIQGSFDFLAAEMRDVPRRQWSIRAVFEPTWHRLADSERAAFMRFSVFRGGCTRDAAQGVTGADLQTLQALINKALVNRDPAGRYQVHELLRQYAEQQLEAAGAMDATRDAHCAHYGEFMQARVNDLKGGDRQIAALDEIEADFENVHAAWFWAIERRHADVLRRMEWALWYFLTIRSRFAEGHDLFRAALEIGEDRVLHGRIMARYGHLISHQREADEWWRRSLAVAREANDLATLAYVLRMRSVVIAALQCDFEQAHQVADECLALYKKLGDLWGMAWALHAKGYNAVSKGDSQSALAFYKDALAIAQRIGNHKQAASALNNMGGIHASFGEYQLAQQHYEESLAICRKLNDPFGIAMALANIGSNADNMGDYTISLQRWGEALDIFSEIGRPAPITLMGRAYVLALTGRFDEVEECMAEVSLALQSIEHKPIQWSYLEMQSAVAYIRSNFPAALDTARIALDYAQQHHLSPQESESWLQIGLCEVKLGHVDAARQHLLHCLSTLESKYLISHAIYGLAALAAAEGQPVRAVELAALVHYHRITRHPFKVYAEELLADLEATLPPDVHAAAVARGKALDLDAVVAKLLEELTG